MQQQSQCRRAAIIEEKIQSSLLLGINTSKRKRGARNSQRTTNGIYIRGGCHLQGNLVNTNGVFPRTEWGTRSAETPCRLKRDSWQGGVHHRIFCRHDDTDIYPETSDRRHHSRIDNTEWGRRNAWIWCSMRLRYGPAKSGEELIDQ